MINKLFEGQILKFIECLNVDYKSTKKDEYMDIFLDVKGCKNVYESFDRLTAEERLEGDNQYNAEGHGMQVGFDMLFLLSVGMGLSTWPVQR